jgi:imidazolonepropionase
MASLLIRGARRLLTLRGPGGPRRGHALNHLGVIENGAVLIDGDQIVEVGSTRRVENLAAAQQAREIDATGRVVMPAFVDCHAHLVSGLRGTPGDPPLPPPFLPAVSLVRDAPLARLRADVEETLQRCYAHGTTAVGALTGFGLDQAAEVKCLRASAAASDLPAQVVPSFFGLHFTPPEFAGEPDRFVDAVCREWLPLVSRRGLARVAHAACGEGQFSVHQCTRFLNAARDQALAVRLDFGAYGRNQPLASLLEPDVRSVDHLEFAVPEDILALAGSPATGVLLPGAAFSLDTGRYPPARALADYGAAVALGTGFNHAASPGLSMQFAVYLACRRMHLTLEEAITAATFNAAQVLNLERRIGSIEPGKQADLIVLAAGDPRALACEHGVNLVDMTIHAGRIAWRSAGRP